MTEQTKTRFPAPLYAAAGAGDLAYQQLRKLPAVVTELSDRAVASLKTANDTANTTATTLKSTATSTDFDKLRETATANAIAFAHAAQERALAVYTSLVAHGERVVGQPACVEAAECVSTADMVTTEEPKPSERRPAAATPRRARSPASAPPALAAKVSDDGQRLISGPRR
ncbi:hypothetical protein GCM10020358_20210 [Amorphoplanes nipponensis]|uniref:hypothetical protein n=1 Tax=Actinoplanes nipponensis TaxID=135950 RepID=UPI0031F139B5